MLVDLLIYTAQYLVCKVRNKQSMTTRNIALENFSIPPSAGQLTVFY